MKLYEFYLYSNGKLKKKVHEVIEKPKTYWEKGTFSDTKFNKSDIGRISGWNSRRLLLIEDDEKTAASIFLERAEINLNAAERRLENDREAVEALRKLAGKENENE